MLEIKNLHVTLSDGKTVLKGINLAVKPGEIHAIMGPNGAGKSTLGKVLAGHPSYEVIAGEVTFKGRDLLELEPVERAHLGLFLGFQYPVELPGVGNFQFLRAALNASRKAKEQPPLKEEEFDALIKDKMELLDFHPDFYDRNVNEGYSGGEKKRNEILQMALLDPDLAVLDETDSGLDIDAMRVVAHGINSLTTPEKGLILITHYQRLLDYIKPHVVHVMVDGVIVQSGGPELALKLEEEGYDWLQPAQSEGSACR